MAAPMSENKQLEDTNILGLPNVHIPQQPNVTRVLSTIDYTLNVNRALRNKINACKEVKVEYELTGGGITGSMDIATFELFRAACRVSYTSFPEDQGYCEKDPGFIYNCKRCQTENTIVKKPMVPKGESSDHENSLDLTKTLTIPSLMHEHSPNNVSTEAAGILEEEVGNLCCVCETRIQDTETTCSKCNNSCHEGCAVSCDGIDQCIACCATDNKQSNTDTSECRPKVMTPQNMNAKNKGNSLRLGKDTTKVSSVDSIPMKQLELRQMENKLRKWEDD